MVSKYYFYMNTSICILTFLHLCFRKKILPRYLTISVWMIHEYHVKIQMYKKTTHLERSSTHFKFTADLLLPLLQCICQGNHRNFKFSRSRISIPLQFRFSKKTTKVWKNLPLEVKKNQLRDIVNFLWFSKNIWILKVI